MSRMVALHRDLKAQKAALASAEREIRLLLENREAIKDARIVTLAGYRTAAHGIVVAEQTAEVLRTRIETLYAEIRKEEARIEVLGRGISLVP